MNREDKYALLDRLTAATHVHDRRVFVVHDAEVDWLRALVACELVRETVLR